ncbi:hypothetical protein PCE1_001482 [Barthelona sp. PCE]
MPVDTTLYEELDVDPTSTQKQIRSKYRKLAMKYHPDRCKEEGAAERFAKISTAYEILSDEEKRNKYDRFGLEAVTGAEGPSMGGFDVFEQFFGGGGSRRSQSRGPQKSEPMVHRLNIPLKMLFQGGTKHLKLTRHKPCDDCDGSGVTDPSAIVTCPDCRGSGRRIVIQNMGFSRIQTQTTCDSCGGRGKSIDPTKKCNTCNGRKLVTDKKDISVSIQPGMADGEQITLAHEGNHEPGKEPGDLIIVLQVKEHTLFKRDEGPNLVMERELSIQDAMLGSSFSFTHLDDVEYTVTLPACSPDKVVCVSGLGMPYHGGFGRGNLYIKTSINWPEDMEYSDAQKHLLQKIFGRVSTGNTEGRPVEAGSFDPESIPRDHNRQQQQQQGHGGGYQEVRTCNIQ